MPCRAKKKENKDSTTAHLKGYVANQQRYPPETEQLGGPTSVFSMLKTVQSAVIICPLAGQGDLAPRMPPRSSHFLQSAGRLPVKHEAMVFLKLLCFGTRETVLRLVPSTTRTHTTRTSVFLPSPPSHMIAQDQRHRLMYARYCRQRDPLRARDAWGALVPTVGT